MAFEQLQDQLTPSMDDEDPRRAGPAPGWSSDPSSPLALETSRRRSHRPWSTVPPRDLTGGLRGQARATKKGTEWLPRQRRNGLVMLGFPSVWSFFWWLFDWCLFLMVLWLFFFYVFCDVILLASHMKLLMMNDGCLGAWSKASNRRIVDFAIYHCTL